MHNKWTIWATRCRVATDDARGGWFPQKYGIPQTWGVTHIINVCSWFEIQDFKGGDIARFISEGFTYWKNLRRSIKIFECPNANARNGHSYPYSMEFLDYAKTVMKIWYECQSAQRLSKLLVQISFVAWYFYFPAFWKIYSIVSGCWSSGHRLQRKQCRQNYPKISRRH